MSAPFESAPFERQRASGELVAENLWFHDFAPCVPDVQAEIAASLARRPRTLSPKFFYDYRGSELFEAITRQPEYYPTRAELEILASARDEIVELIGRGALLVEYGSGSSRKIRALLEELEPCAYMPIDISRSALLDAAGALTRAFSGLEVHAICADYSQPLVLPFRPSGRVAGFFPGSSIGNFEPQEAARFLTQARATLDRRGVLLVGVDRRKDRARLEAAYDDAAGFTAAFNRNVLVHLCALLGGDVDPDAFRHHAFYDEAKGRIEMHLVAKRTQAFRLGRTVVRLRAGESIHTESSYKYAPDEFAALARGSGFAVAREWTDGDGLFSLFALRAR